MAWVSMTWCWHRSFLLMMACVCSWSITCCKSGLHYAVAALLTKQQQEPSMVRRGALKTSSPELSSASAIDISSAGARGSTGWGRRARCACRRRRRRRSAAGPVPWRRRGLVLGCVDGIMDSFRFYNGASVRDVRLALDRGCGLRGDFDVLRRLGGDGYDYGGGPRGLVTTPAPLLLGAVVAVLLWG
ncbi:hypothetical protein OsJ_01131 [Oryza sativa Japonica Group]|uniref:DUF7731 domain-containing protein n=1 Tax=Oryza sativa subsp. japonica TaxID=39947 RepID=A2ZRD0_ORYSJ|nr:hypothetical protein OsJ_01131 [Oryza sativa Japonica Group]